MRVSCRATETHGLFEDRAQLSPEAVAVSMGDISLSYAELDGRANRLAHHLRGRGVREGDRVALVVSRSVEAMVGVLGILKSGAAYVPIDPAYPKDRIALMLTDARPSALLTEEHLLAELPETAVTVVCFDRDAALIEAEPASSPGARVDERSAAYVIYTSGSTGRPKAVIMTHRALVNLIQWQDSDASGVMRGGVTLQFTPLSFDVSFQEMFSTWNSGGSLVLVDDETRHDPVLLLRHLDLYGVQRIFMPFVALRSLTEAAMSRGGTIPRSLRCVVTAGEQLHCTPELKAFFDELPGCRLHNHYGPSETHVVSAHTLSGPPSTWPSLPPIGRPIANSCLYVLGHDSVPVPRGTRGELFIGGTCVGDGYLGRPEITAERFVPDPYSNVPGARLYRTGDVVRLDERLEVEYLGRADNQIKIRGFRVELGEVEAALRSLPGVRDAAVLARDDSGIGKRLVGYIVADGTPDVAAIKRALASALPDYMVPSAFAVLDAFPLTPSGKVDRKALPEPDFAALSAEHVAPRTPLETSIARIWMDVLGLPVVGVDDDFFDLGGHSLLATRVVTRLRDVLGVDIRVRAIFASPTVAGLASQIGAMTSKTREPELTKIPRDLQLRASFAQERMWFASELDPTSTASNIAQAYRIRGKLDVGSLERSLREIVSRHEILRTTLSMLNGQLVQVVHAVSDVPLARVEAEGADVTSRRAWAQAHAERAASRVFDLGALPSLVCTLVTVSAEEHVLLLAMHHVSTDEWSMQALHDELSALYVAYASGSSSPLGPLAVQYADYAVWQRSWLGDDVLAEQTAYWKRALDGAPAQLELPTDRTRPSVKRNTGATHAFAIPRSVVERVRETQRREGATLFMVLFAAYAALLSRWSGQQDVVVGTPIANRTRAALEPLIGCFVNTLALRTSLHGRPTFRELIARVRESALGAFSHQEIPFERLVEVLRPARDPSRNPIFQSMFVLQNARTEVPSFGELEVESLTVAQAVSEFDLTLAVSERDGGLTGELEYDSSLFDASTMVRMGEHFVVLLDAATQRPEEPITTLPLMTEGELHQLMLQWNTTRRGFDELPVPKQVERQVAATPDAIALTSVDGELTYRALNARANRLARVLRARGIGTEDRVGTWFERSMDMVVAALAVLKVGAAYVPLDPAYPPARIASTLLDAGSKLVLSMSTISKGLSTGVEVLNLDDRSPGVGDGDEDDPNPSVEIAPAQAAYVIYTSGTTGRPKGAVLHHLGLSNLVSEHIRLVSLTPKDRVSQISSPAFDASMNEIWPALTVGCTLCIVDDSVRLSPVDLVGWLTRQRVTVAELPTALLELTLEESWRGTSVRVLTTGGQTLHRRPRVTDGFRLVNTYGPTETTAYVTRDEVEGGAHPITTIGRPIQNTTIVILGPENEPVPANVYGQICVGGVNVGRGYLGRPGLTAEKFIPDPFSSEPGARLYLTGDRGRWAKDGRIEFAGRHDDQVKIRGYRIELGEVESALKALAGVRECTVVVREQGEGNKRLVAYVVASEGTPVDVVRLRDELGRSLPAYMLPSTFVAMESLPLTPSGKVNRHALPVPEPAAEDEGHAPPRDPLEKAIALIWSELLGTPRIGIDDDFFVLGGHSLLATRVVSQLRATMGVDLSVRALFESPTVARLGAHLRAASSVPVTPAVAIERVDRSRPMPTSFAQSRLWFIEQLEGQSATYNLPIRLRLTGQVNDAVLERCLQALVERHETLRTTFVAVDGEPRQVVHPAHEVRLAIVDASTPDEYRAALEREAHAPFDLANGPVVRGALVRHAGQQTLVICIHHIAIDGWSTTLVVRELAALYEALVEGRPSPLTENPIDYADFAAWQREWLTGEVLAKQVQFWKSHLAGAPPALELPLDRSRPATKRSAGDSVSFELSAVLASRVRALCRREGATPFMVLLAAYKIVLWRWSGQSDIVVGTAIANRTRRETESIVGLFVNTLALRTTLADVDSFRDVIERVRRSALGAYSHQDLPFEKLVDELKVVRDLSRAPVFQAFFTMENIEASGICKAGPELELSEEPVSLSVAKFDVSLSLEERADVIHGDLEYDVALFDRTTVERFATHFETLLEQATRSPDERVSRFSLMSTAERHHVVVERNDTSRAFDERPVHEGFEAQAAVRPDAVAIVDGPVEVSYGALDRRANQLARHLRSLGVGREDRVATWFPRSVEMVVAALAVMKTGAAYVPLDPAHPASRLGFIVKDAGAKMVLSTSAVSSKGDLGVVVTNVDVLERDAAYAERGADDLSIPCDGRQAAYVIYTSGTTGQPKGAVLEHHALSNVVSEQKRAFSLVPGDRVAQLVAPAFDSVMNELWPTLTSGASLYIVPDDVRTSPEALGEWLRSREISATEVPTILAESLLEEDWSGSKLRVMTTGGEALRRRPRPSQPFRLINQYGPTETTVFVTAEEVAPGPEAVTTIGGPIQNTTVYVLDDHGEPAPLGLFGEIHVGGVNVGRGYVGRASLTAEKFVPDPFGKPGRRLYRTGDRGRWLADGRLEFAGRNDGQVKIRGFRIELGEVESLLTGVRGVRECVVVAREHGVGDKRLVAYVVASAGTVLDAAALRAELGRSLPYYMVPSAFVTLDSLPLTPNGKVDKKSLPSPDFGAATEGYVAPRNEIEHALCDVFAAVLGLPRVGINDNFFESGGHSLLASRLMARIAKDLGFSLPVRVVFELPTVAGLAPRLGAATEGPVLAPSANEGPFPLSLHQSGFWHWEERHPGTAIWNQFNGLRLVGPLDVAAFSRAVDDVRRRHGTLRTSFVVVDGTPLQVLEPPTTGWLEHFDVASDERGVAQANARRVIAELTGPSDLLRRPLARARLVSVAPDEHWFATSAHRILMDGIIGQEFLLEVVRAYADALDGRPPGPAAAVQYPDYSEWQRKVIATAAFRQRLARYRARLEGAQPLALPFDRSPPARSDSPPRGPFPPCREIAHYAPCPIAARSWENIDILARQESTTPFVIAAAAFKAFLATVTGQSDVVLMAQSSLARGSAPELATMLGSFINFLVLRTDLGRCPTLREIVRLERTVVGEARAHADLPVSLVLDEAAPWDSPFAVTLNFIPGDVAHGTWRSVGDLKIELLDPPETNVTVRRPRFSWFCEGKSSVFGGGGDLFDEGTIEKLASRFSVFLAHVLSEPDERLVFPEQALTS